MAPYPILAYPIPPTLNPVPVPIPYTRRELEGKVADLEKRYSRAGVAAERREMRAEVAEAQRLRQSFEKQAADARTRLLVRI